MVASFPNAIDPPSLFMGILEVSMGQESCDCIDLEVSCSVISLTVPKRREGSTGRL